MSRRIFTAVIPSLQMGKPSSRAMTNSLPMAI